MREGGFDTGPLNSPARSERYYTVPAAGGRLDRGRAMFCELRVDSGLGNLLVMCQVVYRQGTQGLRSLEGYDRLVS